MFLLETNRSLLRYENTIIVTSLTDSYVSRCAPEECNKILTNILWYAKFTVRNKLLIILNESMLIDWYVQTDVHWKYM